MNNFFPLQYEYSQAICIGLNWESQKAVSEMNIMINNPQDWCIEIA